MASGLGKLSVFLELNSNRFNSGIERSSRRLKEFRGRLNVVSRGLATFQGILGGIAIARLGREFITVTDSMKQLESQLRLVTDGQAQLNKTFGAALKLANETRSSLDSTITLYARLSRATETLDLSQDDLLSVTKAINQSFQVSGASAQEAASATIQLSQGLAAGALRGEEFNSVNEQAPRIMRALADSLGVTRGELRELAFDGQLTAEKVTNALLQQASVIETEFQSVEVTVAQAFTQISNNAKTLLARLDDAAGGTDNLAQSMQDLAAALGGVNKILTDDFINRFKRVARETSLWNNTIAILAGRVRQSILALLGFADTADETAARMNAAKLAASKLHPEIKKTGDAAEESRVDYTKLNRAFSPDSAREAAIAQNNLADAMNRVEKAAERNVVDWSKLNLSITSVAETSREAAIRMGDIDAEAINAARAAAEMEENMREFNNVLAEVEQEIKDQRRIWDNLIDGVQNAWVGFFEDVFQGKGIDSIKDFLNRVKDLFLRVIAEIAAAWTASKIFGGDFGISLPGINIGGGGGFSRGAGNILGGASKLFGPVSSAGAGGGAAVIGGGPGAASAAQASAAGLPTSFGLTPALGAAGAFAALFLAFNAFRGGPSSGAIARQNFAQGLGAPGPFGSRITQAKSDFFAAGPNIGFASEFARGRGIGGFEKGGVGSFDVGSVEQLNRVLEDAAKAFEEIKITGSRVFEDVGVDAKEMGNILRDGVVTETEMAVLGMRRLLGETRQTKTGTIEYADVTSDQFSRVIQAVQAGELRMAALRGETMLNQQEIDLFGKLGLTAAELMGSAFEAASDRSAEALARLRDSGVSAFGDLAAAAGDAAAAASRIGGGGDPNVGNNNELTREVKRQGRRRSFGQGPFGGGGK